MSKQMRPYASADNAEKTELQVQRGTHQKYDKRLPLFINKILIEESDYDYQESLTCKYIQDRLYSLFNIKADKSTIRRTLNAVVDYYRVASQLSADPRHHTAFETRSILITDRTGNLPPTSVKRGSSYQYAATGAISPLGVEHLLRLLRLTSKGEDILESEQFLLSSVSGIARKEIKSNLGLLDISNEDKTNPTGNYTTCKIDNLTKTLLNISRIEQAIRDRESISFNYHSANGSVNADSCHPHYLDVMDGFYYLVSCTQPHKALQYDSCEAWRNTQLPKCSMYRVDQMSDLVGQRLQPDDPTISKKCIEVAKEYSRACVNRCGSAEVAQVTVRCHNPAKAKYLEAEFSNKRGFQRGQFLTYTFVASTKGIRNWALKWLDVFEVIAPKSVVEDIKNTIASKNVYGITFGSTQKVRN